jgi:hypothetical protein
MNMTRLALAAVMLCTPVTAAYAASGGMETGPGCGLGAMMWADSASKKHIVQQSLIATTNGIGSQTLAISSGTSGCTNDGVIVQHEKVNMYAGFNYESLVQEMAQGQGEHLTSLAALMGVPADQQPALFELMQAKYDRLVQRGQGTSVTLLSGLYDEMGAHPALASYTGR